MGKKNKVDIRQQILEGQLRMDKVRAAAAVGTTKPLPTKSERKAQELERRFNTRKYDERNVDPNAAKKAYIKRNRVLRSLGFLSYKDYLKSKLWMQIRTRVLNLHKKCFLCGEKATQVHHRRYSKGVLAGKDVDHLYAICGTCHKRIEFSDGGIKLEPSVATNRLIDLKNDRIREGLSHPGSQ